MDEASFPFHPRTGDQLVRRTKARPPDRRARVPYDYTDEIVMAVNAALSTDRPLLLRGTPGCGKSTLAADVALALDRDFEEKVVTSRTTAADLLWSFDAVRRLSDSTPSPERARDPGNYVQRGLLWNAFAPGFSTSGAVILVDEIDKADPDVPNDLLLPLGEGRFLVTDTRPPTWIQRAREVLVVITTNGERELPPAFLRRCVSITLEDPSKSPERLERIARAHLAVLPRAGTPPAAASLDMALFKSIVDRVAQLSAALTAEARRPGTAEILDALKACFELGIVPGGEDWKTLTRILLYKESGNPDAAREPA